MKFIKTIIDSNIFISLAAVFLALETQVGIVREPHFHPYLLLIFFCTMLEYNLQKSMSLFANEININPHHAVLYFKILKSNNYLVAISLIGTLVMTAFIKTNVLIALIPVAALTMLYYIPISKKYLFIFRLRQIPYLKIFLISFVWSAVTVVLPFAYYDIMNNLSEMFLIFSERFLFVFAITIPFDIRDIESDRKAGLKTITLLLNEKQSIFLANLTLFIFLIISFFHYIKNSDYIILSALTISAFTTFIFINHKKIRNIPYYHYGILDGTMLLQGALVLVFYYIT